MDFIEKYDNVLNKTQCDQIIELFEDFHEYHHEGRAGGKVDYELKKSTSLDFTIDPSRWQGHDIALASLIFPPLLESLDKYKKKYYLLDSLASWSMNKDYHMQRFDKDDGYYAIHCEQEGPTSRRIIAWMFYLNNAKCGTKFYYQNRTISARQGRLLLWPAGWTHMHSGIVPNIDTKYIITGWYSFDDDDTTVTPLKENT
tara:strand:+ start:5489 stop:6088 length:600 start_codon:yes stop_codon:yes gene_type:complete